MSGKIDLLTEKKIDQITYQIAKHKIWQILWEGRVTMEKISGSVVVTEAKEVLCGLYNAKGDTISSSAGLLVHILGVENMIKKIYEWYAESPGIYEGDVFIFNDAYIGGSHTPDQACLKPFFYKGELVFWGAALFHTSDVGAVDPGAGISPSAREIFHEGIRFPGLKVMEKGVERRDFYKFLERSVRDPLGAILDVRARVGSLNVVEEKLKELMDKYTVDTLKVICEQMIIDTEAYARGKLLEYPDGEWSSETYLDHNGLDYQKIKLKLKMTKKKDHLTFDFSESEPQTAGCMNMTPASLPGYIFTSLCTLMLYDEHWNKGITKVFSIKFPEYPSILSAEWPGAISASVIVGMSVFCLVDTCVSKMQCTHEKYYIDQNASWDTNIQALGWGGSNQHGFVMSTLLFDSLALGQGAGPTYDGSDTGVFRYTPEVIAADVEMNELIMPFLYMFKRQAVDSSGPGKQRGGSGLEIGYLVYKSPGLFVTPFGRGKKTIPGPGLWGGHGAPPLDIFFGVGTNLYSWIKENGRLPRTPDELRGLTGEVYDVAPNVAATPMKDGDFVYVVQGGGGGYGDPLDRDVELVLQDIKKQLITGNCAENIYGVIFNPPIRGVVSDYKAVADLSVNASASIEKRKEIIQKRKQKSERHEMGGAT